MKVSRTNIFGLYCIVLYCACALKHSTNIIISTRVHRQRCRVHLYDVFIYSVFQWCHD